MKNKRTRKTLHLDVSCQEIKEVVMCMIEKEYSPKEITEMVVGTALLYWGGKKYSGQELENYIGEIVNGVFTEAFHYFLKVG